MGRISTSENLELACLQFKDHGAWDTQLPARCGLALFRETPDHRLGLGQRYIVFKSVLGGYRTCSLVCENFAIVIALRQLVETQA